MGRLLALFLVVTLQAVLAISDSERISQLETRVASLEATLAGLEPMFVARYGLKPNCIHPTVKYGTVECAEEKLRPGVKCTVTCKLGYLATPGKTEATCQDDGYWSVPLQCEVPLVLVSGGYIDQSNTGDSGVELLSLYPSRGCDNATIRNMPLLGRRSSGGGSHRTLHNMLYIPPWTVLACNGMSNKRSYTSCDELDMWRKTWTWKHHSEPHESIKSHQDMPHRYKGRYAAGAYQIGGSTIVMGGMLYDATNGHDVTSSARSIMRKWGRSTNDWEGRGGLDKRRAFFCGAIIEGAGVLITGGLGRSGGKNVVDKSVEYYGGMSGLKSISKFADMNSPRSGHGCAVVPGEELSVIVAGGTKGFGQTAVAESEIFDLNTNTWKTVASMNKERFGHALVRVGEKIFAIGGDDRNPNNVMDTIEEYDGTKNMWKIIEKKLKKPRTNFGYTLIPHSLFDGCDVTGPLTE